MLRIKIGTKVSTPREAVSLKDFYDLKYLWFAGHHSIPVGVIGKVSYVDGDSITVLTNAVRDISTSDGILASSAVYRSKLCDVRA